MLKNYFTKRNAENVLFSENFKWEKILIIKFRCRLDDQSINALVSFKAHYFQKEEQEEKDRKEKEILERIELLHQQASAKNLDKTC